MNAVNDKLASMVALEHAEKKSTMKPQRALLALCAASTAILGSAIGAPSQTYTIDWFTIDGGGGTSTGGVYAVSGTIGQPDAGHMSGGNFSLDGGFWSIIAAVQTPGAPTLRVVRSSTNTVIIAWPV